MGCPRIPEKVKLIAGLLSGDADLFPEAQGMLERAFGGIDYESRVLDFAHTKYYSEEMGEGLKRKFVSFRKTFDLKNIYTTKLETNKIERRFMDGGKRIINIDPGYLNLSKVVLFSTKDYTHRIYLNKGIFSEVTLYFKDKTFCPWPWTYPDYKSSEYIDIFNSVRDLYRSAIRN